VTGYCHQRHRITINISLIQYFSDIFASFSTVSSCVNTVFAPKHPRVKISIELVEFSFLLIMALVSWTIAPVVDLVRFACKELPRSKINATERARWCVYTYGGNLKFYRFGIRFQLGSYKSSVKWRMAILLREMRSRWWYMYSKSSSWDWLAFYLFLLFSIFLSLSSCLIDGTRVVLRLPQSSTFSFPFHSPSSDKESVFANNLSSYRSSTTVQGALHRCC